MRYRVDLIDEVVLLVDRAFQVRDAFHANGPTDHDSPYPAAFYTYRGLLTLPGVCALCGQPAAEALTQPCVSSGGYHSIAGADESVPQGHRAESRSLILRALHYDDLTFFVEADNLFPIDQIVVPIPV